MPLVADVTLDSTTWAALALVLTILGAAYTWFAWRRRGITAGLRGLAWTLIPVAAWLTGTLKLAANIINDVLDWATRLVFSPTVWLGVVVAGVAAALWVGSGLLKARGVGTRGAGRAVKATRQAGATGATRVTQVPAAGAPTKTRKKPPGRKSTDDIEDLDDIEAILKKHGI